MKKTIYKIFFVWEYKKEEEWLNTMSQKGWQLIKAKTLKYVFEKGEPAEYEYRLELLDETPDTQKSKDYLDFLEATDIQYVGKSGNWIYLRKKTGNDGFEWAINPLYYINHAIRVEEIYQSVKNMFIILLATSFLGTHLFNSLIHLDAETSDFFSGFFIGLGIAVFIAALIFLPFMRSNLKKIKQYVKDFYVNQGI